MCEVLGLYTSFVNYCNKDWMKKPWICHKMNEESMQFHEKALKTDIQVSFVENSHSVEDEKSKIQLFYRETQLNFLKLSKVGKMNG